MAAGVKKKAWLRTLSNKQFFEFDSAAAHITDLLDDLDHGL